jgi:hypothetical protein
MWMVCWGLDGSMVVNPISPGDLAGPGEVGEC